HVLLDVLSMSAEIEDRVTDELPRSVEGRLPAAVGLDDVDLRVFGDVQLAFVSPPAERDDRWVLQEDHRVWNRPLRDGTGERPLQIPCLAVRDGTKLEHVGPGAHAISLAAPN